MNRTTEFTITGNLTSKILVRAADCLCTEKLTRRTLNLHVPFLSFYSAKMACDKYSMNTMVGPFQVSVNNCIKSASLSQEMSDLGDFYNITTANPAVLKHCQNGGRRLHWLGYRDKNRVQNGTRAQMNDFVHVSDNNESVAINAWRPGQPNAKGYDQCIMAYLAQVKPTESW